jgi:hypothetical protein
MITAVSAGPLFLIFLQVFGVVLLRHETERGPIVDRPTWDRTSARCSRTPSGLAVHVGLLRFNHAAMPAAV